MLQTWLVEQRRRGRAYQPHFRRRHLSVTWLGASPPFVLTPVLSGSLLLVLIAAAFSRWVKGALPYPHHWL